MFDNDSAHDGDIWDEETGETVGQARARFAKLGSEEVAPEVALALIKAGYEVWSFGYGDDPAHFTTVDYDDVESFEEDVEDAASIWGPFRFDESLGSAHADVRFLLGYAEDWTMSPFIDPVTSYVIRSGLSALSNVGISRAVRGELPTRVLGISHVSPPAQTLEDQVNDKMEQLGRAITEMRKPRGDA